MEPKNELKDTTEIVRSLSTRGNRTFQMTIIWKHRSLLIVTELVVSGHTTLESLGLKRAPAYNEKNDRCLLLVRSKRPPVYALGEAVF